MNLSYQAAAQWLLDHDGYLILTHVRPDGDTVGCAAALCTALREQGKTAWVLPNPETTAIFTPYLEGFAGPRGLSAPDRGQRGHGRSGALSRKRQQYLERVDLAFDHHPSQEFFAQNTCLDAQRAAAAS